jgi:uncharacterized protein YkwD
MRRVILLLCSLTALAAPGVAAAACPGAADRPTAGHLTAARQVTLCLLNVERRKHHLAPLRIERRLQHAAGQEARKMVAEHFFAHTTPAGKGFIARLRDVGYATNDASWFVGENLAWGTLGFATPASIVNAWMHSPEHRENILEPRYRQIGIGIALGAPLVPGPGATYTNEFGVRH